MPDSNLSSQEASTSIPATKEEFLARALAVQDQLRAQNLDLSDLDLKLSSGWWKPAVDFSAVLHESVPKDINEKLTAASQDFVASNYSREALDKLTSEVRTLLSGHDEALQLFEATVLKNPSVWDQMREHMSSQGKSSNVFETCILQTDTKPTETSSKE